jgi:hypothetical protein
MMAHRHSKRHLLAIATLVGVITCVGCGRSGATRRDNGETAPPTNPKTGFMANSPDENARQVMDQRMATAQGRATATLLAAKDDQLTPFQQANGISKRIAEAAIKEWSIKHGGNFDWNLEEVKAICLRNKESGIPVAFLPETEKQSATKKLHFTNYTTTNGLSDNCVNGMTVSRESIYAATERGLCISHNGGESFAPCILREQKPRTSVQNVSVTGNTIYAASYPGLMISIDGGKTFFARNKENTKGALTDIVNGVYANGSVAYAATDSGISISNDSGDNWTHCNHATPTNRVFVHGDRIYLAHSGGIEYAVDALTATDIRFPQDFSMSDGLKDSFSYGVWVNGQSVYAATKIGLGISTNAGRQFNTFKTRPGGVFDGVRSVQVSGGIIYVGTEHGVSISVDEGESFTNYTTDNGLGSNMVFSVLARGGRIYAATAGGLAVATLPNID